MVYRDFVLALRTYEYNYYNLFIVIRNNKIYTCIYLQEWKKKFVLQTSNTCNFIANLCTLNAIYLFGRVNLKMV
jgi:hypothetical protein